MNRYTVIITRDVTESTVIEVEAATREQAETAAFKKLWQADDTEWSLDHGSWNNGDTYITTVDSMELIDPPTGDADPASSR